MLTEIQKRWVADLRSGLYKQARFCLVDKEQGAYCCLGVAQCITLGIKPHPQSGLLTEEARVKLGLSNKSGQFNKTFTKLNSNSLIHTSSTLSGLNDLVKLSFEEIADFIESEPEGLFLPLETWQEADFASKEAATEYVNKLNKAEL